MKIRSTDLSGEWCYDYNMTNDFDTDDDEV